MLGSVDTLDAPTEAKARKAWMIGGAAAAVLVLVGFGWYFWTSGNAGPDQALLESSLTTELPAYVKLTALEVQASENTGTRDQPQFRTRFRGTLVLTANTFVQSSVEDDVVIIAPRLTEGTARAVDGLALSTLLAGVWKTDFSLTNNPLADIGDPLEAFKAERVIITGSPEEVAFREEQRRVAEEQAQLAQARQREDELSRQAQLAEARGEAERIRAEARREAERLRADAAREAAARTAQAEADAQRLREQAQRSASNTVEAKSGRGGEDVPLLGEIPARTELNVRLSSSLNSGTAKVEDRFEARTVEDLTVKGRVIVPAGSVLRGIVASVQPATRTNRTARMVLSFDQLTVNGRSYPIRGTVRRVIEGPGLRGEAGRIAGGGAVGAVIGGILGGAKGALAGLGIGAGGAIAATEGKEVELPEGSVVRVRIESRVQIG